MTFAAKICHKNLPQKWKHKYIWPAMARIWVFLHQKLCRWIL